MYNIREYIAYIKPAWEGPAIVLFKYNIAISGEQKKVILYFTLSSKNPYLRNIRPLLGRFLYINIGKIFDPIFEVTGIWLPLHDIISPVQLPITYRINSMRCHVKKMIKQYTKEKLKTEYSELIQTV